MPWRKWKSTRSAESANCVEIVDVDLNMVAIKDSKDEPWLSIWFDRTAMRDFIEGVKVGEFDRIDPVP